MKISILYHTRTGKTADMANEIKRGIEEVSDIEVRLFPLDQADPAFIQESKAVIVGSPTYAVNACWQVKQWFDEGCRQIHLGGKLGAAFATADFPQGGADITILNILTHMIVHGMLVYSGGGACQGPIIHLGPVCIKPLYEESRKQFQIFVAKVC